MSNWYELIKTSKVTANNIISIEIIIRIIFFRLRMKPKIPMRNKTSDNVIILNLSLWY